MKTIANILLCCLCAGVLISCASSSAVQDPDNDWHITMLDGSSVVTEEIDRIAGKELVSVSSAGRRTLPVDSIAQIGRTRRSYSTEGAIVGGLGGAVVGTVVGVQSVEPEPPKSSTGYFGHMNLWSPSTAQKET